jgi:hypothetical protein
MLADFALQSNLHTRFVSAFVFEGDLRMTRSPARLIFAIIVAAIGIFAAVLLALYAEADDAPGGVLLAVFVTAISVALGACIALRRVHPSSPTDR